MIISQNSTPKLHTSDAMLYLQLINTCNIHLQQIVHHDGTLSTDPNCGILSTAPKYGSLSTRDPNRGTLNSSNINSTNEYRTQWGFRPLSVYSGSESSF